MKRLMLSLMLAATGSLGQEDDSAYRLELSGSAARLQATGTLQSGITPIDLQRDLALADRWTPSGRLVFQPWRRHRFIVEGSPYTFEGRNELTRQIVFQGQLYEVRDVVKSSADITYVAGGYQYDVVSNRTGHWGLRAMAAYLDATGSLASEVTGLSASRSEKVAVPLVGTAFRACRRWCVTGEVDGMGFGSIGYFIRGSAQAGIRAGPWTFLGGYGVLRVDLSDDDQLGIYALSARISGPVFTVQFRVR